MSLEHYITIIDRYLAKEERLPLIVDVQNREDLSELVQHYHVGETQLIDVSKYCKADELPHFESLLNDLATIDKVCLVTGVTIYLKLKGEKELRRFLRSLLSMTIAGYVIFVTYQCKKYLNYSDPRLSRRIVIIDNYETILPEIIFTAPSIPLPKRIKTIKGMEKFAGIAESENAQKVYMVTAKQRELFPYALYKLSSLRDAYDALVLKDAETIILPRNLGTDGQWQYALQQFNKKSNWADLIDELFTSHKHLENVFPNYKDYDNNKKWIYFVALKLFGTRNNWCIATAVRKASCLAEFPKEIYRCLLEKTIYDNDFWDCYQARKVLLKQMGNPGKELASYCKIVLSRGKDAIYYLTDNTLKEQETIFAVLDQYGMQFERKELIAVLGIVFPALYNYLQPYRFGNELLEKYFQDYKFQKVINKIFPEFEKLVEEQATKREYNLILQPRASILESLNRSNSQLYFMDAMGVEYLGYILSVCKDLNLMANVIVCRAELPSITCKNKEFVEMFADAEQQTVDFKELDDIKHHGKYDYDFYKNSKLPIHLIKELEVINNVLIKIRDDLANAKVERVFMISDHGASRLAVIHDTENIWEMQEKGVHSGRCCPKSDVDVQPDFATDAEEFWSLANYDRFKGGRKANVEVHGGATLEEICVPVIEIMYLAEKPEIILLPVTENSAVRGIPEIKVSFRKKAAIKVFSTVGLKNVNIFINDTNYIAEDLGNNYYQVNMPELKKPGTYYVDVYSGNNMLAEKLPFIIKKEGQSENKML